MAPKAASTESPAKAKAKATGKAKAGGKAKAKAKAATTKVSSEVAGTPVTAEQKEWCEKFQGVPLEHCSLEDIPVPPTLNSAQIRIWKLLWERGQNHLRGERTELGGPDDAMRKVLDKINEADPDTLAAADHVRIWLRWFDDSFAEAFNFMDLGSDEEET
eukprot:TRINITY_DN81408_c0_g1_i1.p1 TRINITY_DN81408_c0_g1~~TRINITY_DN81408_c0_g1_i1.p1  ORF type:complete len:160 (+),score=49.90 TRINITY_DN81408_c0_g1_i1:87-566(+)